MAKSVWDCSDAVHGLVLEIDNHWLASLLERNRRWRLFCLQDDDSDLVTDYQAMFSADDLEDMVSISCLSLL